MTAFTRLRWWQLSLFLAVLALIAAFYFDAAVVAWVSQHRTAGTLAFMQAVSLWGDWPSHIVVGVIAGTTAHLLGCRRWRTIFAAMIIACALAGLANRAIKIAAGRSRPSITLDAGWKGPRFGSKYNSFPSGHTAATTAFFTALCLGHRRIGLLFLPIPVLIAASRIYTGAHYLSDVIFAAILAVLCAIFVWRVWIGKFAFLRDEGNAEVRT